MSKGSNSFSIAEAKNFSAFGDWNYQELDLRTATHPLVTASYITYDNPAKKVVIYQTPGTSGGDAGDVFDILLNVGVVDTGSTLNDADFNASEAAGALSAAIAAVDSDGAYIYAYNVLALGGTNGLELLGQAGVVVALACTRGWGGTTGVAHTNGVKIYALRYPWHHGVEDVPVVDRRWTGAGTPTAPRELNPSITATSMKYPIITIENGDLPFTLSGVPITNLHIHNRGADSGDADDYLSVLSFH